MPAAAWSISDKRREGRRGWWRGHAAGLRPWRFFPAQAGRGRCELCGTRNWAEPGARELPTAPRTADGWNPRRRVEGKAPFARKGGRARGRIRFVPLRATTSSALLLWIPPTRAPLGLLAACVSPSSALTPFPGGLPACLYSSGPPARRRGERSLKAAGATWVVCSSSPIGDPRCRSLVTPNSRLIRGDPFWPRPAHHPLGRNFFRD
jgi:hypothetical protein